MISDERTQIAGDMAVVKCLTEDRPVETGHRSEATHIFGGGDASACHQRAVENAKELVTALQGRGFAIVSGGTDSHLMLVDLRPKGLTGKLAEQLLDRAGITVNKNTIPDDPESPFVTSGIRLGTPALTTRGMGKPEMRRIATLIDRVLVGKDDATIDKVRSDVEALARAFPLYQADPA